MLAAELGTDLPASLPPGVSHGSPMENPYCSCSHMENPYCSCSPMENPYCSCE